MESGLRAMKPERRPYEGREKNEIDIFQISLFAFTDSRKKIKSPRKEVYYIIVHLLRNFDKFILYTSGSQKYMNAYRKLY